MPAPRPAQAITHHPTPRRAHPHVVQSASPATILVTIVTEFVAAGPPGEWLLGRVVAVSDP